MTTQRAFNIIFGADVDPSLRQAQAQVSSQLERAQRAAGRAYGRQQQALSQQLRAVSGNRRSLLQMDGAIRRASASLAELEREAQGLEELGQDAGDVRREMERLRETIDRNQAEIRELEQTDFGRRIVEQFRESQRAAERHRRELERNGEAAQRLATRQARLQRGQRFGARLGVAAGVPLAVGGAFLGIQAQQAREARQYQRRSGLEAGEFARQEFILRQSGVRDPGDLIAETQREGSIKASEANEEFRLMAEAIGSSREEIVGWINEGRVLEEVLERIGRLASVDQARALEAFFGGTGGEQAREVDLAAFRDAQQEAADLDFENLAQARQRMLDLERSLVPLTLAATEFAGVMATGVEPALSGLTALLTPIAQAVGDMNERFPILTQILGTVGVVGLVAAVGLGGILALLPGIVSGATLAGGAVRFLAASLFTLRGALVTSGVGALLVGLGIALDFAARRFGWYGDAATDAAAKAVAAAGAIDGAALGIALPDASGANAAAGSSNVATPAGAVAASPILRFAECPDELKGILDNTGIIARNTDPAQRGRGAALSGPNGITAIDDFAGQTRPPAIVWDPALENTAASVAGRVGYEFQQAGQGYRAGIRRAIDDPKTQRELDAIRGFFTSLGQSVRYGFGGPPTTPPVGAEVPRLAPTTPPVDRELRDVALQLGLISERLDRMERGGAGPTGQPSTNIEIGTLTVAAEYQPEAVTEGVMRSLEELSGEPARSGD